MDINEDFLSKHREAPRHEFASALAARLERIDAPEANTRPWAVRMRPVFAGAAALAPIAMPTFSTTLPREAMKQDPVAATYAC